MLILRLKNVQASGKTYISPSPMSPPLFQSMSGDDDILDATPRKKKLFSLQNGALQTGLKEMLTEVEGRTKLLGKEYED